jgi:iron complex outermembrane receptor protein
VDDIVETESFALFANTIVTITDRLEFSGGLRFSDDEKTFAFQRLNIDGSSPIACDRIEVAPGVIVLDPTSSPNCLVGGLNDTPPQVFSDDRIDYRAALSYFPSDNVTLFASASTGYKAGGANARAFFAEQIIPHDSEEVTAFELGGKFDLLNNTLRLNASIFQNDYQDIIVTLFNCSSVVGSELLGSPCFLPVNLGEAEVQGFELEMDWAPINGLLIDGSYGYLDFEYTETGGVLPTDTQQAYTPETTWSIGAQYEIETSFGTFTPRIDAYYQDDIFTQPENTAASFIESRTLANASITWADEQNNWQVRARVENLTDEYYNYQVTDFLSGGNGYSNTNPAAPRTYMVTVRRNFN